MARSRVLFLCTGNACRSQMAEGWARHLFGDRLEPLSAGVEPETLDPRAVAVMAEAGIDISGQYAKHAEEFANAPLDLVVTVCNHARELCPVFTGNVRRVHKGFDDPPLLAVSSSSDAAALACYRRVRDEIRAFVATLPELLNEAEASGRNPQQERSP